MLKKLLDLFLKVDKFPKKLLDLFWKVYKFSKNIMDSRLGIDNFSRIIMDSSLGIDSFGAWGGAWGWDGGRRGWGWGGRRALRGEGVRGGARVRWKREGWGCVLVAGGVENGRGGGKGGNVHACMYASWGKWNWVGRG